MKYYLDTEFHEYKKSVVVAERKKGDCIYAIDTIELISIGIVSENIHGRVVYGQGDNGENIPIDNEYTVKEYYAICKDFDIWVAWHNEWLRDNVLKSIWEELHEKELASKNKLCIPSGAEDNFCYKSFKRLINTYGKTRETIAEEIKVFTLEVPLLQEYGNPEFYAYYADYDWVVFCWLFGRMIDLPKGFPMYCRDLQQTKDELFSAGRKASEHPCYPKQVGKHNALADAKWNKELHEFLMDERNSR